MKFVHISFSYHAVQNAIMHAHFRSVTVFLSGEHSIDASHEKEAAFIDSMSLYNKLFFPMLIMALKPYNSIQPQI